MDFELMKILSRRTPEEEAILSGKPLDRGIYTAEGDFVVLDEHLSGGRRAISVRTHTRYAPFPPHRHNYVEMMIVLSGSITHLVEGESVKLEMGDILFLNKHATHSIEPAGEEDLGVNVIMSDSFVDSVTAGLVGTPFASLIKENGREDGGGMYLHFSTAGRRCISNLIENLLMELTAPASEMYLMSRTAALLLYYLSREEGALVTVGGVPSDKEPRRKREILSYIRGNYRTATLSELSGRLYLSVPYLSRLVAEYFGKSFKELLVEERMARARELLVESDMAVMDIIRAVGYENDSYFHRSFKKSFGMTPLAARKTAQNSKT